MDNAGYDLVIECNGIMRHIQLKSTYKGAKTSRVKINTALTNKPSGCVVWMFFDPETVDLGPFYWFGGSPGGPLPPLGDRVAKHTKGDAKGVKRQREKIRELTKTSFEILENIDGVADYLFQMPRAA